MPKSRTTPYPNRLAYDSITRPMTLIWRPGLTALIARSRDSRVRSTRSLDLVHVPDQVRRVVVAVDTTDVRRHVEVDDVAVPSTVESGAAAADDLVDRGAQGLGKPR